MKRTILLATLLALTIFAVTPQTASAEHHVNNSALGGGIKQGISTIPGGETIALAPGTYSGTDNNELFVYKDCTIYGDGLAGSVVINGDGTSRAFLIGNNVNVTIDNITFTGGYANSGGAIYLNGENSTLTIKNCIFTDNEAFSNRGGAICSEGTNNTIIIENCTFTGNEADKFGGAIYNLHTSSTLTLKNCTFTDNKAGQFGGAIYNESGVLNISGTTTFTDNITTGTPGSGGAIGAFGSTVNISDTVSFSGNTATNGSAIFVDELSTLTNTGTINNSDTIRNEGTIYNTGTIDNQGTIYDSGSFTVGTRTNNKITPVVTTWPAAASIVYGQALSASVLSGGVIAGAGTGIFNWTSGTTAPPAGTGSYEVTFTPANTADYYTLVQNVSVTVKAIPTAAHLDFDLTSVTYDGNSHSVSVTVKSAYTDMGGITVKYNGNTTVPTNADTYSVTVDIDGTGSNFTSVTGLSLGDFTITPRVITFAVDAIGAQTYTGNPITPTPTVNDGSATLTATTDYTVAYGNHTDVGTATVTITGAGNYAGSTGSATFTINKATSIFTTPTGLTATYGQTLNDVTLPPDFTWEAATTTPVGNAGNNPFTVKYTSPDPNYADETGISVTVTVNPAVFAPTDKIQITLPGTGVAVYPGQTVTVDTVGLNLIPGSTVTFEWKLDGRTVGTGATYTLPSGSAGSLLTVTLTASGYAGSLVSAPVMISAVPPPPPPPTPTRRQIYLSAAPEGFTYDRPAGTYYIDSRGDFVFVIITTAADTPGALKAGNHPLDNLIVTTGTARDTDGRVILERIATDSMRVTIKMVNQNITIMVRSGTPDGTETVEGAKVWSYGGALYITAPASGIAQVYSLTGQLVKTLTYVAGETVTQPLARGVYIVRTAKQTWKVSLNQDL